MRCVDNGLVPYHRNERWQEQDYQHTRISMVLPLLLPLMLPLIWLLKLLFNLHQ